MRYLSVLAMCVCVCVGFRPDVGAAATPSPFGVLPDFARGSDFSRAGGIALGPDGSLYVLQGPAGGQRLEVYSPAGQFARSIGAPDQFSGATDVEVDSGSNVYVADQDRVQKFDASGVLVDPRWGGAPATFLASGGGQVVTIRDQTLRRLTPSGELIAQQASPFGSLDIDDAGVVYVAAGQGVFAVSADGSRRMIGQVASPGRGAGVDEFSSPGPQGIAITDKGDLYAFDPLEARLLHFKTAGMYVSACGQTRFKRALEARALAASPDGTLFVVDRSVVRRFAPVAGRGQDGCLDQYVTLSRLVVKTARAGQVVRRSLRFRASASSAGTVRIYQLPQRKRLQPETGMPRRVVRKSLTLRPGANTVRLANLPRGRYRATVDAADNYGNSSNRRSVEFSAAR